MTGHRTGAPPAKRRGVLPPADGRGGPPRAPGGLGTAVAKAAAVPFGIAARIRRARALHPHGHTYEGRLHITGARAAVVPPRTPVLGRPGEHDCIVRVSKAVSTPGRFPDILGIAVRLPLEDGPADLLFASTGSAPGLRHVLMPRVSYTQGAFTTLLPYDLGGRTRVLGLLPASGRAAPVDRDSLDQAIAAAPLAFRLVAAPLTGRWEACGTLYVHRPLLDHLPESEAFDPELHSVPGLHPAGPFQTFRRLAYAASRRASDRRLRPPPTSSRPVP
ncbi:phosphodiesterase [Actinomadura logoneensis]|uniref:Phosphodiesterase n=1 Tax=Actinomadura logoneensis TaxID=2293572 RepID=A0A372JKM8_9ACTN|nr:phosphodiesterase [Actinomadura logoneensis]RFU40581.1 phosphodiesterase [Actinomadura logoneensis]